jgi:hypothetical protein
MGYDCLRESEVDVAIVDRRLRGRVALKEKLAEDIES